MAGNSRRDHCSFFERERSRLALLGIIFNFHTSASLPPKRVCFHYFFNSHDVWGASFHQVFSVYSEKTPLTYFHASANRFWPPIGHGQTLLSFSFALEKEKLNFLAITVCSHVFYICSHFRCHMQIAGICPETILLIMKLKYRSLLLILDTSITKTTSIVFFINSKYLWQK